MRENENFRETVADIRATFGDDVRMLKVPQVAAYLNCDRRSVKHQIEKRKLTAVDVGTGTNKEYRVPVESLARFITNKGR